MSPNHHRFAGVLLLAACYVPTSVEGLPCADDRSCGEDHVCARGYCRAQPADALAGCGDDSPATGEFCYPRSRRLELPIGEAPLRSLAWADLNGDARDDAITVSDAATTLHLNLDGAFNADAVELALTPGSLAPLGLPDEASGLTVPVLPRGVALGDFAGAATPDLVFAAQIAVEVPADLEALRRAVEAPLWLVEVRGTSAAPPQPIPGSDPLGGTTLAPRGLRVGDFDGDGRRDLLVLSVDADPTELGPTELGPTDVRWLPGSPEGLRPPRPVSVSEAHSVAIADVDEDGRDDLVLLHANQTTVSWIAGPLDSAEAARIELEGPALAFHVGHLNDTPGLDLAILRAEPATREHWSWSDRTWEPSTSREGPAARDITGGDLDGDGVPDVITAALGGVAVHSGFRGPQLGAPFTIVDEAANTVELRLLDGDAAPDLVLTHERGVVVWLADP